MKRCTCDLCEARELARRLAELGLGWEDIELKTGLASEGSRLIVGLRAKGSKPRTLNGRSNSHAKALA